MTAVILPTRQPNFSQRIDGAADESLVLKFPGSTATLKPSFRFAARARPEPVDEDNRTLTPSPFSCEMVLRAIPSPNIASCHRRAGLYLLPIYGILQERLHDGCAERRHLILNDATPCADVDRGGGAWDVGGLGVHSDGLSVILNWGV